MPDTNTTDLSKKRSSDKQPISIPIYLLLAYVVCTFFPVIYVFFPILGKWRAVLFIGVFYVISYWITKDHYKNKTAFRHGIVKAWIWFLLIMAFGVIFSGDRGRSQWALEVCLKYFIMFAIMIKILDTPKRLELLLMVFGFCAVGMSISAVYNFISGQLQRGGFRAIALASGIFGDPNDLNLLLNAALPFLIFFVMHKKHRKLSIFGIIMIVTAVMLSFSRGGFLGMFLSSIGFYMYFGKKNKKAVFYLALSVILFFFFAPDIYKERLSTIYNWDKDVGTGLTGTRLDAWRILTFYTLARDPIFGSGPGMSIYAAGAAMNDWHAIHNSFIQVLVEMGLTGLFCYSLLFIIPFRQYKAMVRKRKYLSSEQIDRMKVTLLSFIGYGVTAVFLPQAFSPVLFILTGVVVAQSELVRKAIKKPSLQRDTVDDAVDENLAHSLSI